MDLKQKIQLNDVIRFSKMSKTTPRQVVILPFLTGAKSRSYAAFSGGLPPLALCGRS